MSSKNNNPAPSNPGSGRPKRNPFGFSMYWMYAIVFLFLLVVFYLGHNTITEKVDYSQFNQKVEKDHAIRNIFVFKHKS